MGNIRKNNICKPIAVLVTVLFFLNNLSPYIEEAAALIPNSTSTFDTASPVTIPLNFGEITDVYNGPSGGKLIVHIQDAHCNYSAQKSITGIMGHLNKTYGINLAALEGGKGDYDLSLFTNVKDIAIRERVSDYFVKEGLVNGAEYFAVNNPDKMSLFGVEDEESYILNLQAWRTFLPFKENTERAIRSLEDNIKVFKEKIYSAELREFDNALIGYIDKNIEFDKYLKSLVNYTVIQAIDTSAFSNFKAISEIIKDEEDINFERANKEREVLIDRLNKKLSRKMLEELAVKSLAFQKGEILKEDFYDYLFTLAFIGGISLDTYPDLLDYSKYVARYENIDKRALMDEIESIEEAIFDKLAADGAAKTLHALDVKLAILKDMFNISLVREKWDYYALNKESFRTGMFISFFKEQGAALGLNPQIAEEMVFLDTYRSKIEKFYEYSFKRDEAFLRNIENKLSETRSNKVILMTGGFHTANIKEEFTKKGYSYVSVVPKIDKSDVENQYYKLLSGENVDINTILINLMTQAASAHIAIASLLSPLEGGPISDDGKRLLEEALGVMSDPGDMLKMTKDTGIYTKEYGKYTLVFSSNNNNGGAEIKIKEQTLYVRIDVAPGDGSDTDSGLKTPAEDSQAGVSSAVNATTSVAGAVAGTLSGKKIAGYTLLEKLGQGGRGDVYKAEGRGVFLAVKDTIKRIHRSLIRGEFSGIYKAVKWGISEIYKAINGKRLYAIKVMRDDIVGIQLERERFDDEIRTLQSVGYGRDARKDVVGFIESGEDQNIGPYFVMEYLSADDGEGWVTLSQFISSINTANSVANLEKAMEFAKNIATALGGIHDKGIKFRDLKPANIFVNRDNGEIKLIDFGLSRSSGSRVQEVDGTIVGTPVYLSPDQIRGDDSIWADLYALTLIFVENITGKVVAGGNNPGQILYDHMNGDVSDNAAKMIDEYIDVLSNEVGDHTAGEIRDKLLSLIDIFASRGYKHDNVRASEEYKNEDGAAARLFESMLNDTLNILPMGKGQVGGITQKSSSVTGVDTNVGIAAAEYMKVNERSEFYGATLSRNDGRYVNFSKPQGFRDMLKSPKDRVKEFGEQLVNDGKAKKERVEVQAGNKIFDIHVIIENGIGVSHGDVVNLLQRIAKDRGINGRNKLPDTLVIAYLDKSPELFEDHVSNGFIGVNRVVDKIQGVGREIRLKIGLHHELSHEYTGEKGDEFERGQVILDAGFGAVLLNEKGITDTSIIRQGAEEHINDSSLFKQYLNMGLQPVSGNVMFRIEGIASNLGAKVVVEAGDLRNGDVKEKVDDSVPEDIVSPDIGVKSRPDTKNEVTFSEDRSTAFLPEGTLARSQIEEGQWLRVSFKDHEIFVTRSGGDYYYYAYYGGLSGNSGRIDANSLNVFGREGEGRLESGEIKIGLNALDSSVSRRHFGLAISNGGLVTIEPLYQSGINVDTGRNAMEIPIMDNVLQAKNRMQWAAGDKVVGKTGTVTVVTKVQDGQVDVDTVKQDGSSQSLSYPVSAFTNAVITAMQENKYKGIYRPVIPASVNFSKPLILPSGTVTAHTPGAWSDVEAREVGNILDRVRREGISVRSLSGDAEANDLINAAKSFRVRKGLERFADDVTIELNVVSSDTFGIPKFTGASYVRDQIPVIGDTVTGADGRKTLRIYVTNVFYDKLKGDTTLLAEILDHEYVENIDGLTHKETSRRSRNFAERNKLSPFHKAVLDKMADEGDIVSLLLLTLERRIEVSPGDGAYEYKFKDYANELLLKAFIKRYIAHKESRRDVSIGESIIQEILGRVADNAFHRINGTLDYRKISNDVKVYWLNPGLSILWELEKRLGDRLSHQTGLAITKIVDTGGYGTGDNVLSDLKKIVRDLKSQREEKEKSHKVTLISRVVAVFSIFMDIFDPPLGVAREMFGAIVGITVLFVQAIVWNINSIFEKIINISPNILAQTSGKRVAADIPELSSIVLMYSQFIPRRLMLKEYSTKDSITEEVIDRVGAFVKMLKGRNIIEKLEMLSEIEKGKLRDKLKGEPEKMLTFILGIIRKDLGKLQGADNERMGKIIGKLKNADPYKDVGNDFYALDIADISLFLNAVVEAYDDVFLPIRESVGETKKTSAAEEEPSVVETPSLEITPEILALLRQHEEYGLGAREDLAKSIERARVRAGQTERAEKVLNERIKAERTSLEPNVIFWFADNFAGRTLTNTASVNRIINEAISLYTSLSDNELVDHLTVKVEDFNNDKSDENIERLLGGILSEWLREDAEFIKLSGERRDTEERAKYERILRWVKMAGSLRNTFSDVRKSFEAVKMVAFISFFMNILDRVMNMADRVFVLAKGITPAFASLIGLGAHHRVSVEALDNIISVLRSHNQLGKLLSEKIADGRTLVTVQVPGTSRSETGWGIKNINDNIGYELGSRLIEKRRAILTRLMIDEGLIDEDGFVYGNYKEDIFLIKSDKDSEKRLNKVIAKAIEEMSNILHEELQKAGKDAAGAQYEIYFGMSQVKGNSDEARITADINAHQAVRMAMERMAIDTVTRGARFDLEEYNGIVKEIGELRRTLAGRIPGIFGREDNYVYIKDDAGKVLRKNVSWDNLTGEQAEMFGRDKGAYESAQRYFELLHMQDYIKGWHVDFKTARSEVTAINKTVEELVKLKEKSVKGTVPIRGPDLEVLSRAEKYVGTDRKMPDLDSAFSFHGRAPPMANPVYISMDVRNMGLMNMRSFEIELQKIEEAINAGDKDKVRELWRTAADGVTREFTRKAKEALRILNERLKELGLEAKDTVSLVGGDELTIAVDVEITSGKLAIILNEIGSALGVRVAATLATKNFRDHFKGRKERNDLAHARAQLSLEDGIAILKRGEAKGIMDAVTIQDESGGEYSVIRMLSVDMGDEMAGKALKAAGEVKRATDIDAGQTAHLDSHRQLIEELYSNGHIDAKTRAVAILFAELHDIGYSPLNAGLDEEHLRNMEEIYIEIGEMLGFDKDAKTLAAAAKKYLQDNQNNPMIARILAHGTIGIPAIRDNLKKMGFTDNQAKGLAFLFAAHHPGYPISMVAGFVKDLSEDIKKVMLMDHKEKGADYLREKLAEKGAELLGIDIEEAKKLAALGYGLDRVAPSRRMRVIEVNNDGSFVFKGGESMKKYPLLVMNESFKPAPTLTLEHIYEQMGQALKTERDAMVKTAEVLQGEDDYLAGIKDALEKQGIALADETKTIQKASLEFAGDKGIPLNLSEIDVATAMAVQAYRLATNKDKDAAGYLLATLLSIRSHAGAKGTIEKNFQGVKLGDTPAIIKAPTAYLRGREVAAPFIMAQAKNEDGEIAGNVEVEVVESGLNFRTDGKIMKHIATRKIVAAEKDNIWMLIEQMKTSYGERLDAESLNAEESVFVDGIIAFLSRLLSDEEVYVFENKGNEDFIGYSNGAKIFINENFINDMVVIFHEAGEGYFASYQYKLNGRDAHQLLRGAGKKEREKEGFELGLQDKLFSVEANNEATERIRTNMKGEAAQSQAVAAEKAQETISDESGENITVEKSQKPAASIDEIKPIDVDPQLPPLKVRDKDGAIDEAIKKAILDSVEQTKYLSFQNLGEYGAIVGVEIHPDVARVIRDMEPDLSGETVTDPDTAFKTNMSKIRSRVKNIAKDMNLGNITFYPYIGDEEGIQELYTAINTEKNKWDNERSNKGLGNLSGEEIKRRVVVFSYAGEKTIAEMRGTALVIPIKAEAGREDVLTMTPLSKAFNAGIRALNMLEIEARWVEAGKPASGKISEELDSLDDAFVTGLVELSGSSDNDMKTRILSSIKTLRGLSGDILTNISRIISYIKIQPVQIGEILAMQEMELEIFKSV